ncbi:3-deoxy-D-manno-octulosonic acid transferase [Glaciecola siphonariae]|uniref:3-deoxy-D-manno-octulosonic acid transferase n=1 Tax=Glaciecola siphonariae TaxID=521012 RepID=A0ABV9M057_9ALTE
MPKSSGSAPRRFSERFGMLPASFKGSGILVHCVSVGELNASVHLVNKLMKAYPSMSITLTTTSTTGAQLAYNLYKDSVQHAFLPFDLPFFMNRFLAKLKPKLVLVTEVEVWPNMLRYCARHGIRTALINARISSESLPTYKRFGFLLRPALRSFDVICAQSQNAYDNFKALGVYKSQLRLTNNMKFDLTPSDDDAQKAEHLLSRYKLAPDATWLAASTHEPEELFVLSVYQKALKQHPHLKLVIVPRHPHRFEQVYLAIKSMGLSVARFSDELTSDSQVILIDTMGYLTPCYRICSFAFIGGSIADKGGHNALEGAMYAKPMMMGPSIFNNPGIVELLTQRSALILIEDEAACERVLLDFMASPARAIEQGRAGKKVLEENGGAVDKTFDLVTSLLQ